MTQQVVVVYLWLYLLWVVVVQVGDFLQMMVVPVVLGLVLEPLQVDLVLVAGFLQVVVPEVLLVGLKKVVWN
jgi:hypothetical protein